jgi:hypothetical protein
MMHQMVQRIWPDGARACLCDLAVRTLLVGCVALLVVQRAEQAHTLDAAGTPVCDLENHSKGLHTQQSTFRAEINLILTS